MKFLWNSRQRQKEVGTRDGLSQKIINLLLLRKSWVHGKEMRIVRGRTPWMVERQRVVLSNFAQEANSGLLGGEAGGGFIGRKLVAVARARSRRWPSVGVVPQTSSLWTKA